MAITGAILGDIAGSLYEFYRPADLDYKHCNLFPNNAYFTDDTVLTLACKLAVIKDTPFALAYKDLAKRYPDEGYGGMFKDWFVNDRKEPMHSFGNGSAMRCSFIGEHFNTEQEVDYWAKKSAECTHNHPEGIKGAIVTAHCIYMAKSGASRLDILDYAKSQYPKEDYEYGVEIPLAKYRDNYRWNATCQGSVPVAIRCFLESENYESFLRNVISLDCDSDTIGAIGGGIAEEFYGDTGMNNQELLTYYLDDYLLNLVAL